MEKIQQATYIAILRGINVSGKNIIKMPALVNVFESLGFDNVKSYVQSGNVIFRSEAAEPEYLQKLVHEQINKILGLMVPVIVFDADYLKKVIGANPFVERKEIDLSKLHLTFLAEEPQKSNVVKIEAVKYIPDEFIPDEKVIYLHCPAGYGNTKLSNNFFENKLKVVATTRNWKTVNALAELAG